MIEFENLNGMFRPESVAVIGASDKVGSVGYAVYANLKAAKFPGRLIAINQQHKRIQGDPAWPSLDSITGPLDLVVVCTPAATVPEIARSCGEHQVRGMIVISAGFRETGAAGRRLETELQEVLRKYPRLRLIGPNCLGVLAPHSRLNASFSATMPRPGGLAVISQSGALCTAMLDWSQDREIGFSAFISVGNMVDVGMGDLIDYFAADEHTTALLLYMESLSDPRHFMAAARACTRTKPIIAFKSGRFAESSQAASSHTGAMAGVDAVYDAAFRRAGIERVFSFDDLFDCAKLLEEHRDTSGPRLAILTNAGGPGIMASDAWLAQRGQMAQLSAESIAALNQALPTQWSHGNPVDVLGDAPAERFAVALEVVARDPGVDSLIVMLTPQSMTDPVAIARTVAAFQMPAGKPLLAVWMGGPSVRPGRHILEAAKVPVYVTPEQAVNALAHLVSAGRLREQAAPLSLMSAPGMVADFGNSLIPRPLTASSQRTGQWRTRLASVTGLLGEVASKELLADYGIPVVQTAVARSAIEAADQAAKFGFPAALKILSPDISHKTDVGGVELNLANRQAVISAYERIVDSVSRKQPEARVEGVSVQPMVTASRGVELLLGATRDAIFGPVIVVGGGGVTAEIQHDLSMQLPPLSERRVTLMLSELRISPILKGYRGRPGVDQQKLTEAILAFSRLVEELPELQAVEINPLLVTANEVIALDARVIVAAPGDKCADAYSHLAVRPYPASWMRVVTLTDGSRIRLRPIRLDDEAHWLQWLQQNPESWTDLRRFPHRACSLDYDSEMLVVAEDPQGSWLGLAFIQRQYRTKPASVTVEVAVAGQDLGLREGLEAYASEILKEWDLGDGA